jgi:hypothetical protein
LCQVSKLNAKVRQECYLVSKKRYKLLKKY